MPAEQTQTIDAATSPPVAPSRIPFEGVELRRDPPADTVALLSVEADADPAEVDRQLEELAAAPSISRVALVAPRSASAALRPVVSDRPDLTRFRSGIWSPLTFLRLRSEIRSAGHLLTLTSAHPLGVSSIEGYLEFHRGWPQGSTRFTPGVHANIRAEPVAHCWEFASLQRSWVPQAVWASGARVAGLLPTSTKDRLWFFVQRRIAARAERRARKDAAREAPSPETAASNGSDRDHAADRALEVTRVNRGNGVGAVPNGGKISVPDGSYLGNLRDQVELLAERTGEFYPFPKTVNMVLTNICNLKCGMCPYHSPDYEDESGFFEHKVSMGDELFDKVAREAGAHGATLKLGQLEETMVHPGLIGFVRRARQEFGVPDVHITTNGTLLTPKKTRALLEAGVTSIFVSLDAATPETYAKVRGWPRGLEVVWKNIEGLIEMRDEIAPDVRILTSFILQPEAEHEHDDFVEQWRRRGIDGVIVYQLSTHEHEDGRANIHGKFFPTAPPEERHSCSSVYEELYVFPEGEVSLCCNTMVLVPKIGVVSMGNVNDAGLEEIWLGRQYSELRKRLILNEIKGDVACENCDIWDASDTRVEERDGVRVMMNPTTAIYEFTRR